ADAGQEVVSRRRVLAELLVATVPVVACCRRADERARLRGSDPRDQISRADDAAVADPQHLGGGPASRRDRFSREVDDGVDAVERRGAAHRVPAAFARAAADADDGVAARAGGVADSAPDEAAGPGDRNSHAISRITGSGGSGYCFGVNSENVIV